MDDNMETVYERRVCPECSEVFSLTAAEVRWFLDRGMQIPRRCGPCRATRRQEASFDGRTGLPRLTTRRF